MKIIKKHRAFNAPRGNFQFLSQRQAPIWANAPWRYQTEHNNKILKELRILLYSFDSSLENWLIKILL